MTSIPKPTKADRPKKEILDKPFKPRKKKSPKAKLKDEADRVFSIWIRRRDYDKMNCRAICISCGLPKSWNEIQNGHYWGRNLTALRFDEQNCNAQCRNCNLKPPFGKGGNIQGYTLGLKKKYGEGIFDILKERLERNKIHKIVTNDKYYADIIKKYTLPASDCYN
jgi:hypothetical protein